MMLLIVELLIGGRADVAQRRVTSPSIIERFDVEEKVGTGLVAGMEHTIMHPFAFQGTEEAFHRGIVVPASDAVHAGLDVVVL